MPRQMSREIGKFLQDFLYAEGIRCPDYPTLTLIRESPPGHCDLVWNFRQLAECHQIADAYLLEAENIDIEDETGTYNVSYLAVVLPKEGRRLGSPLPIFDIEEVPPEFDEQKMMERAERVGERTKRAILSIAGLASLDYFS